jgi:NTE family protein
LSRAQEILQPVLASDAREDRHAVVLSGGGANGAYEVGVLRALFEGRSPATGGEPLTAQVFTGSSVGAYNAAFMAQSEGTGRDASRRLEDVWRQRIASTLATCGNGVYRLRANPLRWADPGCLRNPVSLLLESAGDAAFWARYGLERGAFALTSEEPLRLKTLQLFDFSALISESPLDELIRETVDPALLATSSKELIVTATDWENGIARFFSKADITGPYGVAVIKASTAIPGIFPPVDLGGTLFVDGGLLVNTPLKPAIDAGSDVLHVVYVDPEVSAIPFPPLPNTLDNLYRIYVIAVAGNMNRDILIAQQVNEDIAVAERLGVVRQGRAALAPGRGLRRINRLLEHFLAGQPYRPVTIHRYRPQLPLGSAEALLDFREAAVDRNIALGYQDALHHDCTASGCILPPDVAAQVGT